ncbi:MAG: hypothetical protein HC838_16845 [Spirulinaceae cyanobacterium RM2_2_10]|nr:hypothetical protein [Spirulinaceae cyanobacterium RM2_2_10]
MPRSQGAIATRQRHDVIQQTGDHWRIQVELCRRWLATRAEAQANHQSTESVTAAFHWTMGSCQRNVL